MKIIIAHMYPDLMNLYGDQGNLTCLKKRLEWLGYECLIKPIRLGDTLDYSEIDMLFMGGGSDHEQDLIYHDLIKRSPKLQEKIETGLPVLFICGAYQLLGKNYHSLENKSLPGLGYFNFFTEGNKKRLTGDIIIECEFAGQKQLVVGFENHAGRTYFSDKNLKPFGKVVKGFGNNGEDANEGIIYKNLIGTYLHGPLLPKNPMVADFFIKTMLERRGVLYENKLNNELENFAQQQVISKISK